jgi:hypothetical protein
MNQFDEEDEVVPSEDDINQDVIEAESPLVDQETGEILLPAPDFNNLWGTH